MDFTQLINQCASQLDYPVAHSIVQQESGFNPFAINVNKSNIKIAKVKNYSQAILTAKQLLAEGYNIDLGLAQINSSNLNWLGLTVDQVFDPCTNLNAMQKVYLTCYDKAGNNGIGTRMQRAFSCYNTGNIKAGFYNNYVNNVTNKFNAFTTNSKGINGKSLPRNGEDLAIYANDLATQDAKEKSVNDGGVSDVDNSTKQHSKWDIFQDF